LLLKLVRTSCNDVLAGLVLVSVLIFLGSSCGLCVVIYCLTALSLVLCD